MAAEFLKKGPMTAEFRTDSELNRAAVLTTARFFHASAAPPRSGTKIPARKRLRNTLPKDALGTKKAVPPEGRNRFSRSGIPETYFPSPMRSINARVSGLWPRKRT